MVRFNKVLNIKLVSLIIVCIFLILTNIAYGVDISERICLRLPLLYNRENDDKRIEKISERFGFQRLRNPYPQNFYLLKLFVARYNTRPVFIERKGKGVELARFSERYRLKYPKVLSLVEYAKISENDVILDPFSGTGGIIAACSYGSYGSPKLLIGSDNGYEPGILGDDIRYATDRNFEAWRQICDSYFKKLGLASRLK